MKDDDYSRKLLQEAYEDGCRRCDADLQQFVTPLEAWMDQLLQEPLAPNWREQLNEYLAEQEPKGYRIEPENLWVLEEEILLRDQDRRVLAVSNRQDTVPSRASLLEPMDRANQQTDGTAAKRNDPVGEPPEHGFIRLPDDYPTTARIAAAEAWETLQRQLMEEVSRERTDQVLRLREALGDQLRRKLLAEARVERRLSVVHSFVDGFVAGLMALRAATTRSPTDIAARDEAFHELGIDRSAAANATKLAAAVAVTAAEAAALLVAGGAILGPIARAFAAYSPTGAEVAAYAAQGLGAVVAGAKLRAAQEAIADGRTDEGIHHAAEAFVLAVLVAAGPLLDRPAAAAAQRPRASSIPQRLQEFYRRLGAQRPSSNADDALRRINRTLDDVEDLYSGIPKKVPPPPIDMTDGRMYPPQSDFIMRQRDGSIIAETRRHKILLGSEGSITIRITRTDQIQFHQPGARTSHVQ